MFHVSFWRSKTAGAASRAGVTHMDGVDSIGFLLRAILYRASQDAVNPIEDLTQDILIASRLLNEYECARWFGLETEGLFPANVGAQMRHSMLKVLCRRGRDFLEPLNAWRKSLPLMPDSAAEGPKACRDSGHLVNVSRAISLISGVQDRRIVCCNSCGLVQNIPIPWSVDFTFSSTRRAVLTIDPKPQF